MGEGSGRMGCMEGCPSDGIQSVLYNLGSWGGRRSAVTQAPLGDWLLSVPQHPAQYGSCRGPAPPLCLVSSSPLWEAGVTISASVAPPGPLQKSNVQDVVEQRNSKTEVAGKEWSPLIAQPGLQKLWPHMQPAEALKFPWWQREGNE